MDFDICVYDIQGYIASRKQLFNDFSYTKSKSIINSSQPSLGVGALVAVSQLWPLKSSTTSFHHLSPSANHQPNS